MLRNLCIFSGNLAKDPEPRTVKFDGKETTVLSFSIAVNNGKDKPCTWVNCEAWDKTADVMVQYARKGDKIAVETTFKEDVYQDKEDVTQRRAKFRVSSVEFMSRKNDAPTGSSTEEEGGEEETTETAVEPKSKVAPKPKATPKPKTSAKSKKTEPEPEAEGDDDDDMNVTF